MPASGSHPSHVARLGIASVLLLLPPAGAAGAAVAAPADVGAPGIGDPYYPAYGNGGYDVAHYGIRIAYSVKRRTLVGNTTVVADATQHLSRFNLDLALRARAVRVDGRPAAFRQHGAELAVTPAATIPLGKRFRVQVRYAGRPGLVRSTGLGWFATRHGAVTMGEPEVATEWFPCNDHPADKATYDVTIRTSPARQAISNGVLVSRKQSRRSATWRWRETSPMVTYAALVAIGDYRIERGVSRGGIPYQLAVARNLPASTERNALRSLRVTPRAVDLFARILGPYPFRVAGGVASDAAISIAIETQTKPVYGALFARPYPSVVVHELAHQWFGDSVSVAAWRDIWLNEGFATWAEWLYGERLRGVPANRRFASTFRSWDMRLWRVRLTAPGPQDLFNPAVYYRGAMAVQALRNLAGPASFSRLVRAWLAEHRHGNASTAEFVALAKRMTDADIDRWYRVWLDEPRRPAVTAVNGFPPAMVRAVAR